jgi:16S rRNA (uracil1498-N3)-methyltransferase
MQKVTQDKHLFALHVPNLAQIIDRKSPGDLIEFKDPELWTRITRILRLQAEEAIVFFDNKAHAQLELTEKTFSGKNLLVARLCELGTNKKLVPEIDLYVGLLKKEAFEEVAYLAAQMGATRLIPVISEKIHRKWGGEKEIERLAKIMVAACEQSKNFTLPELCSPINFQELIKKTGSPIPHAKIYFDVQGQPFFNLLTNLTQQKPTLISLIFGPEGGFTDLEMSELSSNGFFCSVLTPTVLRATQAVAVGLGAVRSLDL